MFKADPNFHSDEIRDPKIVISTQNNQLTSQLNCKFDLQYSEIVLRKALPVDNFSISGFFMSNIGPIRIHTSGDSLFKNKKQANI